MEPGWTPLEDSQLRYDQARAAVLGWQQTVNAAWEWQTGLLGAATRTGAVRRARKLTPQKMAIARSFFGDSLNTDFVTVTEDPILGAGDIARTIPYTVNFPPGTLTNPPPEFNAWLVHELTHIWQYQHGRGVEELLGTALVGDYDYGGEQGLRDALAQGKTFISSTPKSRATSSATTTTAAAPARTRRPTTRSSKTSRTTAHPSPVAPDRRAGVLAA